jgi:hypothetical protein
MTFYDSIDYRGIVFGFVSSFGFSGHASSFVSNSLQEHLHLRAWLKVIALKASLTHPSHDYCLVTLHQRGAAVQHLAITSSTSVKILPDHESSGLRHYIDFEIAEARTSAKLGGVKVYQDCIFPLAPGIILPMARIKVVVEFAAACVVSSLPWLSTISNARHKLL